MPIELTRPCDVGLKGAIRPITNGVLRASYALAYCAKKNQICEFCSGDGGDDANVPVSEVKLKTDENRGFWNSAVKMYRSLWLLQ